MGLFSKKTIVCEKCGKEFEARITFGVNICDDCLAKQQEKRNAVKGYVDYAAKIHKDEYSEEQLEEIAVHRKNILEKYKMMDGISRAELQHASDNYKKLSDNEASDILFRIAKSSISSTAGAVYSAKFFVPTSFEKTIVDAEDIFAVGLVSDYKVKDVDNEVILCAVFTNDSYIPVFPMIYLGKLGFFDFQKSKKGRQGVGVLFEELCPNLTYPVQDLKQLKKQIKSENTVKGNIDMKLMLDMISDASSVSGIFNTKALSSEVDSETAVMLDEYGYIQEDQINRILKMDKMFNRNYWNKQIKKLSK